MTQVCDLEERAREAAGNWEKFESFSWYGMPAQCGDGKKWMLYTYSHRDADSIARANAIEFEKLATRFPNTCHIESHGHWAVGHVDVLAVKVYRNDGKITKAFTALCEMLDSLEDYPVLDEEKLSEIEYEDFQEAWKSYGLSEWEGICKGKIDTSELTEDEETILDYIDYDTLWEQIANKLNWEYQCSGNETLINFEQAEELITAEMVWAAYDKAEKSPEYLAYLKKVEDGKLERWNKAIRGEVN